jgi:hypothetical protein
MNVEINVQFTEDELRKYAEDVGRRWFLTFVRETIKEPGLFAFLQQAIKLGIDHAKTEPKRGNGGPIPSPRSPEPFYPPPPVPRTPDAQGPFGPSGDPLASCLPVEESRHHEEGWACHVCATYNTENRRICRHCSHERCDVSPPPDADPFGGAPQGVA